MKRVRTVINSERLAAALGGGNEVEFVVVKVLTPGVTYLARVIRWLRPRLAVPRLQLKTLLLTCRTAGYILRWK